MKYKINKSLKKYIYKICFALYHSLIEVSISVEYVEPIIILRASYFMKCRSFQLKREMEILFHQISNLANDLGLFWSFKMKN